MNKEMQKLREKPHWSFSSINRFMNICSLQWAFQYHYKLEPENMPVHLLFGTAFHGAASWIAIMRKQNIYPTNEEAETVFSEMWQLECNNADERFNISKAVIDELNIKGKQMISCLNSKWIEDNIVDVSKSFSVLLPGTSIPLIGEIDLIVKDDKSKHVLIDWKTSGRKWASGKADTDLQATCFMYGYEQIEPTYNACDSLFRYDVVTKTKEPAYQQNITHRNRMDFIRLAQFVRTIERAVNNEIFLPNETGFYCGSCQFKSACKTWHMKQATTIFPSIAA